MQLRVKNEIIKKLQTDIHNIERLSDEFIRRTRGEAEKQQQTDIKNSEGFFIFLNDSLGLYFRLLYLYLLGMDRILFPVGAPAGYPVCGGKIGRIAGFHFTRIT